MNVETGTVAAKFLFWEYLFRIFGICNLQCRHTNRRNTVYKKDGQEIAVIGVLADYMDVSSCSILVKNVLEQILLRMTELSNEPGMNHPCIYRTVQCLNLDNKDFRR